MKSLARFWLNTIPMHFKEMILTGFLALSAGGVVVACAKTQEPMTASERTEERRENLAERLDELENDWIRTKAKAEGKSDVGAEIAVMRDEIDESFTSLKEKLKGAEESTEDERARLERDMKEAISTLERKIEQAKRDLS